MMDNLMNSSKIAPFSDSRAASPKEKEKAPSEADSKGFMSELSQAAAAMQGMPPQAQPTQPAMPLPATAGLAEKQPVLQAGEVLGNGKAALTGSLAERAFFAQKPAAAGMNAGAAIAGLKPWSRDWVFAGEDHLDADLKAQTMAAEAGKPGTTLPKDGALPGKTAQGASLSGKTAAPQGLQALAGATRGDAAAALAAGLGVQGAALTAPASAGMGAQPMGALAARSGAEGTALAGGPEDLHRAGSVSGQPDSVSAPLHGLNGALEGLGVAPQAGTQHHANALQGAQSHSLTGGEFLSTLSAVRGGMGGHMGAQSDLGNGGGSSGSGEQGLGAKAEARPSLRVIDGGRKDDLTAAAAGALGAHSLTAGLGAHSLAPEVTGNVTQGAGARERLSSDSLANVASSLRNLSAQGGGEMRVRLKPDNLGELHVRVVANGSSVGLQIQASSDRAKRILEESISHLRESMATQSLRLASVDLTVAHHHSGASAGDSQGQSHGQHHAFQQDAMGQGSGQGGFLGGRSGQWAGDDGSSQRLGGGPAHAASARVAPAPSTRTAGARTAAGRLDVTA